ncbi:secretory subunit, partial [Spiromyces aspiralis]
MARYTYDESGVTFYYFALTIVGLITVPATLAFFVAKGESEAPQKPKTLKLRQKKAVAKSKGPQIKAGLVVLGWIIIALLAYQVKITPVQNTQTWDPYEILGIDPVWLTDDVARENYEKYGHPDGLQTTTMGIALPKWLVEAHASPFVLGVYGLVFGFVLPFYVGRWWYRSSRFTKDSILNPTMSTFFKNIRENISQRNLVEIITAAH